MMHCYVFSQTQPVKWWKIYRWRRKKIEMTHLLCNGSSDTVWSYYIFFERVSVLVRMHLLYNVGQACFFEHEWGLLLVLCAYGVYRVRVVVLGACQVGLALCTFEWRWAMLFVKSLLLGACQVATWHVNCQSKGFSKPMFERVHVVWVGDISATHHPRVCICTVVSSVARIQEYNGGSTAVSVSQRKTHVQSAANGFCEQIICSFR